MRRGILLVAAVTLALVFVSSPATAIINGTPDGNTHPNVAAILGSDVVDGQRVYFQTCSGSLLTDRLVLTAAHCALWESVGKTDDDVFISFDPDLQAPQPVEWASFGPVVEPDTTIAITGKVLMPGFWTPASGSQSRNDVAVIELATRASDAYPEIEPIDLPDEWFLSGEVAGGGLIGHRFTNVGFGFQQISMVNPTTSIEFNGLRMRTTSPYVGLERQHLVLQQTVTATGQGGLCLADSGGPQFFSAAGTSDGNLEVALNVGRGQAPCGTSATPTQRLDVPAVLDFLHEQMAG